MIYLQHTYMADLRGKQAPDDYVGPFPSVFTANMFKKYFGPVRAAIVEFQQPPDPDHTISPGTFLDDTFKRA